MPEVSASSSAVILPRVSEAREAAFYYPGVIWRDAGWVKSLALFFDEVALLVPDYMRDRPHLLDPAIAGGLQEAGLLRILSPETLVDRNATERLATAMAGALTEGALDALPDAGPFQELSWSRMGGFGDDALARMVFDELHARGLARQSEDEVSIPLHPAVRSLFLVLLAQILRESDGHGGPELSPATDRPEVQAALVQLLRLPSRPSAAEVVTMDLEVVGPDLDAVPLDEVMEFRAAHGSEFRAYARRLRGMVREIGELPTEERTRVLDDRREEIREAGEALRRGPVRALSAAAGVGLGIAGGTASAITGDPLGGILSASAAAAGAAAALPRKTVTPYSYLFSVGRQFS